MKTILNKDNILNFLIYAGIMIHISMFVSSPFFGSDAREISIYLAFVLIIITRKIDFREIFLNKMSLAFILYFTSLTVSTFISWNMGEALSYLAGTPMCAFFLFFSIQILSKSKKRNDNIFALSLYPFFLAYMVVAAFIPAAMGIDYGYPGLSAFGDWHNKTARYWNIVLPFTIGSFFIVRKKSLKYLLGLFITLSLIGIPLTLSRGGTISLAVMVLLFVLGIALYRKNIWKKIRIYVWYGLGISVAGFLIFYSRIAERFAQADWTSITGRADKIWPAVWGVIQQRPLSGYGFSRIQHVLDTLPGHSHNIFLQVLFNGGIFGLFVFLILCFIFLKEAFKQFSSERDSFYSISFIVVFIAVIGVHGLIEVFAFNVFSFFLSSIWFLGAYRHLNE